jgi:cell division protein ZapB
MADSPLTALEGKIDELIALCTELNRENQQLKADSAGWYREKRELIDQNELARNKVTAMIDRLRSSE